MANQKNTGALSIAERKRLREARRKRREAKYADPSAAPQPSKPKQNNPAPKPKK